MICKIYLRSHSRRYTASYERQRRHRRNYIIYYYAWTIWHCHDIM